MHGRLLSLIICITICLSVLCPQALAVSQPESTQTNTGISTVIGDVNGDNVVHVSDYLLIKKYISGGIKDFPVSNGFWAADVNDDGALDILDLMYVKKYILHIINTFPKNSNSDNFIKVSGKNLVKGNTPIILKGVCFGNKVWSNPSTPPETHHSEVDYTRVKEMNMNAIRFYLNYNLFEDDSNPYSYKQSGWDWLDKNISWAKKNGIYLILNMHCPQGGYQ